MWLCLALSLKREQNGRQASQVWKKTAKFAGKKWMPRADHKDQNKPAAMNNPWGVIMNPKSGKKKASEKETVADVLRQSGVDGYFCYTSYPGHAGQLVQELAQKGVRRFVAVGGDGSISELVDGLMNCGVEPEELTFGFVPQGTGNDWARYWQMPDNVGSCAEILNAGALTWGGSRSAVKTPL